MLFALRSRILPVALALSALACAGTPGTRGDLPSPAAPGLLPPAPAAPQARPDIVLVIIDTLRHDRLDAQRNGVPLMPRLSAFARESVYFDDAVTACTWTKPAVTSIFTSLHAGVHGVWYTADPRDPESMTDALPGSVDTLAAVLQDAGYATLALQTNPNLTEATGLARGFDRYDYRELATAETVTDWALDRLAELQSPFFLYLHYMDPHGSYDPPDPYKDMMGVPKDLDPRDRAEILNWGDYYRPGTYQRLGMSSEGPKWRLSPQGRDAVQRLYDGEVRYTDDQLARVLDYLQAHRPGALVVVVADHGEEFWDHGSLGHGMTLYEEVLRVPLLIHGAGLQPRRVDRTVETLAILPTVAGLLGLTPNPSWEGRDLLADPDDEPLAFSSTRGSSRRVPVVLDAVIAGGAKLILDQGRGQAMLFDRLRDPADAADRAASRPGDAAALRSLLELRRAHEAVLQQRLNGNPAEQAPLDPAIAEQLRSIGYGR